MAFVTKHASVRQYHRRELAVEGDLSCSLYCDIEQPEETFAPFRQGPPVEAGFCKDVSLDWTQLTGHIDEVEAGSETVRGGYVWIAARLTTKFAAEWLESHPRSDCTVLELGAGTGVVGILVSKLTEGSTVVTDGNPAMLQLLQLNTEINRRRNVVIAKLLWGEDIEPLPGQPLLPASFDLVVASDLLYSEDDVTPLWSSVERYLSHNADAAFILGHQERHTVTFDKGIVGESEQDEVLVLFQAEASKRGFLVARVTMTSLVPDEDLIHLLLCTRRPAPAGNTAPA